ncbi:MAG: heme-binding protein [Pirellulaceae bacterium]
MKSGFRFRIGALSILAGGLFAVAGDALAADAQSRPDLPPGYISEAPLPEGYPPPAAPGKVVEKSYPQSRTYSATGRGAFFKCFSYLSLKRHEMTAPVVMDYPQGADGEKPPADSAERMHFILEQPALDKTGKKLLVEVADMPKLEVVSVAFQGDLTAEVFKSGEKKLREYAAGKPGLKITGDLRVLGYNSPSVKPAERFWEIQLPVAAADR